MAGSIAWILSAYNTNVHTALPKHCYDCLDHVLACVATTLQSRGAGRGAVPKFLQSFAGMAGIGKSYLLGLTKPPTFGTNYEI